MRTKARGKSKFLCFIQIIFMNLSEDTSQKIPLLKIIYIYRSFRCISFTIFRQYLSTTFYPSVLIDFQNHLVNQPMIYYLFRTALCIVHIPNPFHLVRCLIGCCFLCLRYEFIQNLLCLYINLVQMFK